MLILIWFLLVKSGICGAGGGVGAGELALATTRFSSADDCW